MSQSVSMPMLPIPDCTTHGKRLHTTRERARAAIRRLHDAGMREYPCDVHNGLWHIGHMPDDVREGKLTASEYYSGTAEPTVADRLKAVKQTIRHARPRANTDHHVPNVLPVGHTRDHYDVDYADGVWGPIRLPACRETRMPAQVWCRRHGWEPEVIPEADLFEDHSLDVVSWGWRCSRCGRTKAVKGWSKEKAELSRSCHVRDSHGGVYELGRLPGGRADRREQNAARRIAAQVLAADLSAEELVAGLDFIEREHPGLLDLVRSLIGHMREKQSQAVSA